MTPRSNGSVRQSECNLELGLRGGTVTMQLTKEILVKETDGLPQPMLEEVVDFVRFIKAKAAQERLETAILSQPVLERDWLRPEEDEAWRDL